MYLLHIRRDVLDVHINAKDDPHYGQWWNAFLSRTSVFQHRNYRMSPSRRLALSQRCVKAARFHSSFGMGPARMGPKMRGRDTYGSCHRHKILAKGEKYNLRRHRLEMLQTVFYSKWMGASAVVHQGQRCLPLRRLQSRDIFSSFWRAPSSLGMGPAHAANKDSKF